MVSQTEKLLAKLSEFVQKNSTHRLFSVSPSALVEQASYRQGFDEMMGLQQAAGVAVAKWRAKN